MIAVISDVHANLEALDAVLDDARRRGVERVWCLGDLVGYGPDPGPCVARVRARCERVLRGNHDHAVSGGDLGFNPAARASLEVARRALEPGWLSGPWRRARWRWLRGLPEALHAGGVQAYHASPRDPLNEYVLPSDCERNREKLREVFRRIDGVCFVGHTHVPGVVTERLEFLSPDALGGVWTVEPEHKAVVNPGAVGQPRDGDPRASYLIYEGARVRFVRVPYEVARTAAKIRRHPALDAALADRLERGV